MLVHERPKKMMFHDAASQKLILEKIIHYAERYEREEIYSRINKELEGKKIDNFIVEDKDDDTSFVTMKIPNYLINKIKNESEEKYNDPTYCNGMMVNILDDYYSKRYAQLNSSHLRFDGKEKIRRDVLDKLNEIMDLLKSQEIFPMFKTSTVRACIRQIIGPSDIRTIEKYYNAIDDCIFETTQNRLSSYEERDITSFTEALGNKLNLRTTS